MMEPDKLRSLLETLKAFNVTEYKDGALELKFCRLTDEDIKPEDSGPRHEIQLPADLRTDPINAADKVLFWSTEQNENDQSQIPGTGEKQN